LRRLLALAPLLAVCAGLLICAATAGAALPQYEYGEVARFGGFDRSAYNGGNYEGTPTPGKFLDPTGFAVDPQDNTVYVVDRTSTWATNPTSWRIQQLSPVTGEVLGTTMFTLDNNTTPRLHESYAIEGLAVDHRAGRLYALVVGAPPSSSPNYRVPVADELLAWSTEPNSSGELVAAGGLPSDSALHTTGGLVSEESQLEPEHGTPLYAPQGIAVDRLEAPGVDNPVAIEASDLNPNSGTVDVISGDTIVQQVATQPQGEKHTGDLLGSWSGASVAEALGGTSWGPHGIFDDPDGTISVLLTGADPYGTTNAYAVRLQPDLSDPVMLTSEATEAPDQDQEAMWLDEPPFTSIAGVGVSDTNGVGPEVAQLSTTVSSKADGPYAADIFTSSRVDYQFSPEAGGPQYWFEGEPEHHIRPNIGVRLLQPEEDGAISNPSGSTIVTTLGNNAPGGPCNIGAVEATLAAGANGTLWALDRGPTSETLAATKAPAGREVIELAPGAGRLCPQPSGTFTMAPEGGVSQTGESTLTVPAGTRVTFDAGAIEINYAPIATGSTGRPFAYEWDLEGGTHGGPGNEGFTKVERMKPPKYYFPPPTVSRVYTRPGRYKVRARLLSDYGAYTTPEGTIEVKPNHTHPDPRFTTAPAGAQKIAFDAASSTPGIGTLVHYRWSWGDGAEEEDNQPLVTHAYTSPGSYAVTLTVINSAYQSATSAPQTVIVEAARAARVVSPLTGPLYAIPFPLYPIPPTSPGGTPTDVSPRASFAAGAVKVRVSCPKTKTSCAGTVRVLTAAAFPASAGRGGRGRSRAKAGRLLLGQASFTLAGGQSRTLSIRLSARGAALLRAGGRLKALVLVAAHDPLGDPWSGTLRLTLRVSAQGHGSSRGHRSHRRA